jgi:undecaprenyl-diphosphatase
VNDPPLGPGQLYAPLAVGKKRICEVAVVDLFAPTDLALFRQLNALVGLSPTFDRTIQWVADSFFMRCSPLMATVYWVWFAAYGPHRKKIVTGMFAVVAASLSSRLLQLSFAVHARPFKLASAMGIKLPPGINTDWGSGSSFPSDTTALHFALAAVIWTVWQRAGWVAFAWVFFIVALPRVYLTYHWPSDIIFGALLGIVAVGFMGRSQTVAKFSEWNCQICQTRPQAFYAVAFLVSYQITTSFDEIAQILRILSHKF